jgi:bifunctional UDP-N-acetylglucosamine pyrophosphorylase/glucosamine-1-phosphate N-acetyltransferase
VKIGRETVVLPGCLLAGEVEIGESCTIGPHTVMHGPVKVGDRTTVMQSLVVSSEIGSDCRVGPFAHLREGARIADHARIGNYVEIKKSEVGSHTNVSHLSYVGDATLGSEVNIGAGTITANYNHITREKSRTVIGDGAFTGSNSVLVAPVEIGHGASVAAGTVVTRDVPDGALAVGRARQENKASWVERRRSQLKQT